MPDRIIRDELFRSPRFIRLTSDTLRLLFIGFLLHADDLANTEAATESIEDILHRDVPNETAARWVAELADSGLVRVYSDPENPGKRLIHIPRFRQRLRYLKGKHPAPPSEIESIEIKELREKVRLKSDSSQTQVRLQTAKVKRSEEKRSKSKPRVKGLVVPPLPRAQAQQNQDPKPSLGKIPEQPPKRAKGPQDEPGIEALARYFGKWPLQGESGRDWAIACVYVNQLRDQFFDGK